MLLFSDIITGDELFSDAYDVHDKEDGSIEVDCQMITVKEGDVDIGANASAEEAAEELESGAETVNNVVYSMRLQSTQFDKKSYMTYLKDYMKTLKTALKDAGKSDDDIKAFEKRAQGLAKKVLGNFKDYEFLTGESMNPDGMVALLNYREDGVTPFITFWADGLKEIKI
ncbi:translationally-controlled tumor protein [Phaffia rhodozyma]|uniref:Translationally-controlled tumor protein homolog n=1 Tax=Phaffia rhodozyma TaxID=264483 RepID=A0A0F7SIL0_PHARH|nr:translationally-controlled tumor protein [Phaffia rhodozyma]